MQIKEILEMLKENPDYKSVLSLAKDDEERKKISQITEGFLMSFSKVFSSIQTEIDKDPNDFKHRFREEALNIIKDGQSKK